MAAFSTSELRRRQAPAALCEDLVSGGGTQQLCFPDTPEVWNGMRVRPATEISLDQLLPCSLDVLQPTADFGLTAPSFVGLPAAAAQDRAAWQRANQHHLPVIAECSLSAPEAPPSTPPPPTHAAPTLDEILETQKVQTQTRSRALLPPSPCARLPPGLELTIKNTFIEFASPGLAAGLERRQAMSCPGSRLATPHGLRGTPLLPPSPSKVDTVESSAVSTVDTIEDPVATFDISALPQDFDSMDEFAGMAFEQTYFNDSCMQFSYDPRAEFQEASSQRPRQVLSLDAAVLPHDTPVVTVVPPPTAPFQFPAEVQLGSVQLPTVGSLGHYDGSCKPCAFFWKEAGCSNGTACSFCHLCDSMEKKRRQKDKKVAIKVAKNSRAVATVLVEAAALCN